MKNNLREGITTGSCATAAAMAALHFAATGCVPLEVTVPLPPFTVIDTQFYPAGWKEVPVCMGAYGAPPEIPGSPDQLPLAYGAVIKDGGDDPDATHGAIIHATIFTRPPGQKYEDGKDFIRITGGAGVGICTKPGLPIAPGEFAINPAPREQILFGFKDLFSQLNAGSRLPRSFTIMISVPDGENIAKNTMNAKLGIMGGISILGTHGIVRPYSHEAFAASLELEIASITQKDIICLATGRRSAKLLREKYPDIPDECFIQVADMAAHALLVAANCGFKKIVWGCFFGKLLKLAQGMENTHAHTGSLDLTQLEVFADSPATARQIRNSRTAMGAMDILRRGKNVDAAIDVILRKARLNMTRFCGKSPTIHLFDLDGTELAKL